MFLFQMYTCSGLMLVVGGCRWRMVEYQSSRDSLCLALYGYLWYVCGQIIATSHDLTNGLGGGFKYFLFSSLFGEDSHFD